MNLAAVLGFGLAALVLMSAPAMAAPTIVDVSTPEEDPTDAGDELPDGETEVEINQKLGFTGECDGDDGKNCTETVFESDMIIDEPEEGESDNALNRGSMQGKRWDPKRIPFYIDPTLSRIPKAVAVIKAAIADYHQYTCLKFVPRTSADKAYFHFYNGGGCSSNVGYHGKVNRISLAPACWYKGIAMHEMGHSLGLYHENARPDRDRYVQILWNNIEHGRGKQFQKQNSINSLGTKYDYQSMMHYGQRAFGKSYGGGRMITIRAKDKSMQNNLGQRKGFSDIDKLQINRMYNCPGSGVPRCTPPVPPTNGAMNFRFSTVGNTVTFSCNAGFSLRGSKVRKCLRRSGGKTFWSGVQPTCIRACYDRKSSCSYWKRQGFCTVGYVAYMKVHCQRTCDYCGGPCEDLHRGCQSWARQGICEEEQEFMERYCSKSCKTCSG